MNADELDQLFGRGFTAIKQITYAWQLGAPAVGVVNRNADVQEQQHIVDATFENGILNISIDGNGDGIWIPYLGAGPSGPQEPIGQKGWGTYSSPIGQRTWAATGKFSGCSIGMFSAPGGTRRFAHLITTNGTNPCATIANQTQAISAATGLHNVVTYKPRSDTGSSIAFMLFLNGQWRKRIVQLSGPNGDVSAINTISSPLV